jgi:PAS domain S-box-containing protein
MLQAWNPGIPCIMTSGRIDDETAVAAMKAGAKDYVMKDNLKRLGPVVERELAESKVRQERRKAEELLKQNEALMDKRIFLSNEIMRLFWEVSSKTNYLEKALNLIHEWSKCLCVGIRIVNERDNTIPYLAYKGFPDEFIKLESNLSLITDTCACIRVILHRPEPQDNLIMTPSGSVYINNSADFASKLSRSEMKRYRGECIKRGFQTIVIVPIQYRQTTLGAIHLADTRISALSIRDIETLESIATLIGQGIYRFDMEEKIKASQSRLAEAQKIAHLGNWEWDIPLNFIFWSDEIYRIFGLLPREFGATYDAFLSYIHPEDTEYVKKSVDAALYQGQPYNIDHRILLKDGSVRFVHEKGEVTYSDEGKPVRMAGTVQDVTDLRRVEEELRALSRSLVEIQENERRSIARELHDEIGQSLTALKMLLAQAARAKSEDRSASLNEANTVITDMLQNVREMSLKLRPSMLDDLGLLPTLLWHFERFTTQTGIRINFKHEGLQGAGNILPPEVNTTAYRVAQEALTNIARYAEVHEADVTLSFMNNSLTMQIQDKGRGFEYSELNASNSTGLSGMRERIRLLGGKLVIKALPGQGTQIIVELPVRKEVKTEPGE